MLFLGADRRDHRWIHPPCSSRFVADSLLEGDGFEPSVPPVKENSFDAAGSRTWKRLRRSN
jgi:hypothetical protein